MDIHYYILEAWVVKLTNVFNWHILSKNGAYLIIITREIIIKASNAKKEYIFPKTFLMTYLHLNGVQLTAMPE